MSVELEARVVALEDALEDFALRYSALEWLVEQHFSRFLLGMPSQEAEGFLNGISQHDRPAFQVTDEGHELPVRPDAEARLRHYTAHIAEKIRTRVRQGMRYR